MSDFSLVAGVDSTREAWTGIGLADSLEGLVDAIRSEGWVDDVLAGAALALEATSTVLDPFSALLSSGAAWAMEYFEPLREILDDLAGMPDMVASHAATWNNIAGELGAIAADLDAARTADMPDWQGEAAIAYQDLIFNNVDGIGGLAGVSAALAAATQAAGGLVSATRDLVRDLIADLVAHVIVWLAEAIFVVTIPVIAAQITAAVVKWAGRIMTFVTSLLTSMQNLTLLLRG